MAIKKKHPKPILRILVTREDYEALWDRVRDLDNARVALEQALGKLKATVEK